MTENSQPIRKKIWDSLRYLVLVVGLTLPMLAPLMRPGFFASDDGRLHVYRTAALARAWLQGVLHPRLFPEFGFSYGQAVFNFYAPLSYWPGALLSVLGFHPATAVKMTMALVILLAALAMYLYVHELWGPRAGVLAAVIYTYHPYHLIDAYVRGAIPELAAFLFPPFILWAYLVGIKTSSPVNSRRAFLLGTLGWAGLVFTHNLSALLLALIFPFYALLLAWRFRRWSRLIDTIRSLILAIALTAVYWLPVIIESSAMGLSKGGEASGYARHLLSWGQLIVPGFFYDYHVQHPVVHPQHGLELVLLLLAAWMVIWRWRSGVPLRYISFLVFHWILTIVTIFMTTAGSDFIWRPFLWILGYLQYPWRFLLLTALGLAVVGGSLAPLLFGEKMAGNQGERTRLWGQWGLVGGVFFLAIFIVLPHAPHTPLPMTLADVWFPERMWQEDAEMGQIGATWTGEFLPNVVTEQRWAIGRPRENAQDTAPLPQSLRLTLDSVQYQGFTLSMDAPSEIVLRLHQFFIPGWQVRVGNRSVAARPTTELGLVTIDAPLSFQQQVQFTFGFTWDRTLAAWISFLAAGLWSWKAWRAARQRRRWRMAALAMLFMSLLLSLNSLGVGHISRTPHPVQVRVGDVAQVLAAEASLSYQVPDYLEVIIYWLALKENAEDYHVFIHVLGDSWQVAAQHDGIPVGGFTPTTRWRSGEIIVDTYHIPLPSLPSGAYQIMTGMYAMTDDGGIVNLSTDPPQPDDRIPIETVNIP